MTLRVYAHAVERADEALAQILCEAWTDGHPGRHTPVHDRREGGAVASTASEILDRLDNRSRKSIRCWS